MATPVCHHTTGWHVTCKSAAAQRMQGDDLCAPSSDSNGGQGQACFNVCIQRCVAQLARPPALPADGARRRGLSPAGACRRRCCAAGGGARQRCRRGCWCRRHCCPSCCRWPLLQALRVRGRALHHRCLSPDLSRLPDCCSDGRPAPKQLPAAPAALSLPAWPVVASPAAAAAAAAAGAPAAVAAAAVAGLQGAPGAPCAHPATSAQLLPASAAAPQEMAQQVPAVAPAAVLRADGVAAVRLLQPRGRPQPAAARAACRRLARCATWAAAWPACPGPGPLLLRFGKKSVTGRSPSPARGGGLTLCAACPRLVPLSLPFPAPGQAPALVQGPGSAGAATAASSPALTGT